MFRVIFWLIFLVILGAAVVAGAVWMDYRHFRDTPLMKGGEGVLWLAPGTSFDGMVGELQRLGLTRRSWRWQLLRRLEKPAPRAGEYTLDGGLTPARLLERLTEGRSRMHGFTIVEGWTYAQLRQRLREDTRWAVATSGLDDDDLMEALGCSGCAPEGRFLPETYLFMRGTSDLDILRRAFNAMESALDQAWAARTDDHPIESPEDLLTLASIVEKETGAPHERGKVAGVFARRMKIGMRLQTDPTVIYGLGDDYKGRITYAHLRTDHPWNTYTRPGLPPTPIALPGRAALEAAARPEPGSALYFVARGDGTHHFSDTLAEHNAAVNRYIRNRAR